MNVAAKARAAAVHMEVKKDSVRQVQTGDWRATFTVASVDMPIGLMTAAPGTRYMLALVQIGDDEQPVSASAPSSAPPSAPPPAEVTQALSQAEGGKDAASPQSAGGHARAAALGPNRRSEIARGAAEARWSGPVDKLVQRVAILCNEWQFQQWIANHKTYGGWLETATGKVVPVTATGAAQYVRRACQVTSRRELSTNPEARQRAESLLLSYDQHTGRAAIDYRSA